MKKHYLLYALVFFSAGCANQRMSPIETTTAYYQAIGQGDFARLKTLIADSLTIVEGDYTTTYSHQSFHEQFRWDSVFQPTYRIVEVTEQGPYVLATMASHSLRYAFLKNNPLTCQHKIAFKAGKISRFEMVACPDADWWVWQKQRDSLVNWVARHHPGLDGFINDLSMQGGLNYLAAIARYENKQTP